MKKWMIALTVVAMLGMTAMADAGAGKAKGKHAGIHGKIASIAGNTVTLTAGGKKNPHTITVTLAGGATVMIDGAPGKLESSLVGKHATVEGTETAGAVTTSSISISTKHHAKKKKAA